MPLRGLSNKAMNLTGVRPGKARPGPRRCASRASRRQLIARPFGGRLWAACFLIAPDPAVAAWCAEPIETGVPGFVLIPPVLRRAAIPVVTDPAEAARRPELAVLSVMAHGESEQGATIAGALLPALEGLDDDVRARFYYDLVLNSLNVAARRALEAMMKGYEYQSDFAKQYVAEGKASALLIVLRGRGIAVPDVARDRILAEKDPTRLERWLEKVGTSSTVAEILADPS